MQCLVGRKRHPTMMNPFVKRNKRAKKGSQPRRILNLISFKIQILNLSAGPWNLPGFLWQKLRTVRGIVDPRLISVEILVVLAGNLEDEDTEDKSNSRLRSAVADEAVLHKLKHRFNNSPFNKLCYYQSYHSSEDAMMQLRSLMEDDPASATNRSLDAGGTSMDIEYDGDGYEPTKSSRIKSPSSGSKTTSN
eukprot:scaffold1312_cov122-Cylindrotheca_fusiformis.AAC.1